MARYIHKRANSPYGQFCLRVPTDLRHRYPGEYLRESLKTADEREAMRLADNLVAKHEATFASMRGNTALTPGDTHRAAQALADELGPWDMASDYFSDKWNKHADKSGLFGHPLAKEMIRESDFLNPVELKALEMLREGKTKAPRLSAALPVYLENHKNGKKKRFVQQATRDWDRLITAAGDVPIVDLTREHARLFLAHCKSLGMATSSVRRCVNNVRAIFNVGTKELDIRDALKPLSDLPIPNEGTDKKKVKIAASLSGRRVVPGAKADHRWLRTTRQLFRSGLRVPDDACDLSGAIHKRLRVVAQLLEHHPDVADEAQEAIHVGHPLVQFGLQFLKSTQQPLAMFLVQALGHANVISKLVEQRLQAGKVSIGELVAEGVGERRSESRADIPEPHLTGKRGALFFDIPQERHDIAAVTPTRPLDVRLIDTQGKKSSVQQFDDEGASLNQHLVFAI